MPESYIEVLRVTVAESLPLQKRYERISDRLKAAWTSHQFVTGTYHHFLAAPLPYNVDFTRIYHRLRDLATTMEQGKLIATIAAVTDLEDALDRVTRYLLAADDAISPSLLRRFFERLKRQDDTIIEYLIRFYLYADAVEADRRDKLDFLFTRLGEDFDARRGEYVTRESLELRPRVMELVSLLNVASAPREEVVRVTRAVRSMRDDISTASKFDDLAERNLLKDARTFKHRVGDLFFDPDVLLAIIELNVAAKNHFLRLYRGEEQRILEDSAKLMEHGDAIERNFGDANPALIEEIARFREFKERFDSLRAQSNIKYDVVSRLKTSMNNILAQLDRGLDVEEEAPEELPAQFFDDAQHVEDVTSRFGRGEPLLDFLVRIGVAIESGQRDTLLLRLEPWEVAAYEKLLGRRDAESENDTEELWMLHVRAAALRVKVDEEATILATAIAAGVHPEATLFTRAKQSLDLAKELDALFADFLQEAVYYSNRQILHQLYRSRFRLLRGFSGLWLIYDRGA
ncbi:MAG: hypothetical protein DMF56_02885 [Acidobacteria bacterium]|nr:MAG: hypothetical protein DMF56_02885 [Acidobacteriota bacterium]